MTKEEIEQRIQMLHASREQVQIEADKKLAYSFGLIDGQIAVLEALLEEDERAEVMEEAEGDHAENKAA